MTQEEKELLLKDLCARLPYSVKGLHREQVHIIVSMNGGYSLYPSIQVDGYSAWFSIETFKPYLRPMSSMTEEEKEELKEISSEYLAKWENAQDSIDKWILDAEVSYKRSEFYNSHLLDWRGLIPKNLAIEAPVDMYKID